MILQETIPRIPEISVVVPVYRNADTLQELHGRLCKALEGAGVSFEILFVDDACPAGSLGILHDLVRSDPRVAVLALASNVGQHRAVLAGLSHARGERAVILDADLQDPPETIPELLAKLQEGYGAVFAGRRGRYESHARLLTSRLFKWLLHKASGVPADAGLFVAMNRAMVERLLAYDVPRPFLVAQMGFTGLPLASIPVARARRPGGGSAYSFWARLMIGVRALLWSISHRRRMSRQEIGPRAHQAPVKAYIGARFSHPDGALGEGRVMRPAAPTLLEEHNLRQRRYFERTIKQNMVPADSRYLNRHVEEALRFGKVSPGERVLEVGCEMGRYTLLLAQRGVRVEGLDLSPVLLERLQGYNGGRFDIPLHCGDIQNPPPTLQGAYDLVLGFFVLHHVGDLERTFQSIATLLHPGGRVVFLEPNPFNPLYYLQILITPGMTWQGDGGIVRMRRSLLFRAMERAGFTRCAMTRFGFFPPFLANRTWGSRFEAWIERVPLWRACLPFQLFRGKRP